MDETPTPMELADSGSRAAGGLIAEQRELDRLVHTLRGTSRFAVDTEADAYFAYASKVCLFQFSTEAADYLVDPLASLDFSGLGELFEDDRIEKILHAGENDVGLLRAQFGFRFQRLFDTMIAAQVVGYQRCGLAPLLEDLFQVTLSKKYQTSDWRERPLSRGQIEYAHADTRHLIALRDRLAGELDRMGRLDEAQSEFRRVESVVLEQKTFDPDGFTRLRAARELEPLELRRLQELYVLRDGLARDADRAPYRVLDDDLLIKLARHPPRTLEQFGQVRGVRPWKVDRFGVAILGALAAAAAKGPLSWPRRRPAGQRPRGMTAQERRLFEQLRRWRDERAQQRGVGQARVATTALLMRIAIEKPTTLAALAALDGMEPWRMKEYGEEIRQLVASEMGGAE